jgi:hypothetical protein
VLPLLLLAKPHVVSDGDHVTFSQRNERMDIAGTGGVRRDGALPRRRAAAPFAGGGRWEEERVAAPLPLGAWVRLLSLVH